MYKQIWVVLCALLTVSTANVIGWRNCGSNMASLHAIRIQGCSQTPCEFVRGNTYEAHFDGTWRANSNTLPFVLSVMVFGLPVDILQGNGCDYKTVGSCPALNNNDFTFSSNYAVPTTLPGISAVARATFVNDFGDIAICVEFDVRLV